MFNRAYFDDAGVVDENVDPAEVADGLVDEHGGLGRVGKVGRDEENVVGGLDGLVVEEGLAGGDEFFDVAGGEDELGSSAAVAFGKRQAEAAGASSYDDDAAGAVWGRFGFQGPGGGHGDGAGENLSSVAGGSRGFHVGG